MVYSAKKGILLMINRSTTNVLLERIHGAHGNALKLQILWLSTNISQLLQLKSMKLSNHSMRTSEDLLTRCISGYTQNNNESFDSTVWAVAQKSVSSGKTILDVATVIAVCVFNDGFLSILHIIKTMNLEIGPNSNEMSLEIDKQRIKLAERLLSDRVKEARLA